MEKEYPTQQQSYMHYTAIGEKAGKQQENENILKYQTKPSDRDRKVCKICSDIYKRPKGQRCSTKHKNADQH